MKRRHAAAPIGALLIGLAGLAPADDKLGAPPQPTRSLPVSAPLQKPDLVVSFDGPGPGLPTGFTVKNIGSADSKICVLKVTAAWVPPLSGPSASGGNTGCFPWMTPAQCQGIIDLFSGFVVSGTGAPGGGSGDNSLLASACGNPFPEVVEAVPVLKPGESKSFTRDVGPPKVTMPGNLFNAVSPQTTHIKRCSPTLVCAWDVTAVVDASNDNNEGNKTNNTVTRRAFREISYR